MADNNKVSVDLDGLVNWIESRPELKDLRIQAEEVQAVYNQSESQKKERIKPVRDKNILETKTQFYSKLLQTIWVPPKNLRGKAYSTASVDSTLGTTSKMLSISSLWDFFCTLPLFTFGLAPLAIVSLPAAVILSYLILWASNVAGEKSTDRHDKIQSKSATFSLVAFLLLSLTKTAFSGVGIDLVLGSSGIQAKYADTLAAEQLEKREKDFKENVLPESEALKTSKVDCSRHEEEIKAKNSNRGSRQGELAYQSAYVRAYGTLKEQSARQGNSPSQIIKKYGSIGQVRGSCAQRDLRTALHTYKINSAKDELASKRKALNSMPALNFLRENENATFQEHFKVTGSNNIEWQNGTTAVAQATIQYMNKLTSGEFAQIGFSLFFFIISLILSITATLLLYQVSTTPELKASFDDDVLDQLNDRLQRYTKALENQINEEN